jgi:hypothetical protein
MKLRHAAALALVGWYLMVPPFTDGPQIIDPDASFSKWQVMDSFDTANACRIARDGLRKWADDHKKECTDPVRINAYLCVRQIAADCIATDDPRLAK